MEFHEIPTEKNQHSVEMSVDRFADIGCEKTHTGTGKFTQEIPK